MSNLRRFAYSLVACSFFAAPFATAAVIAPTQASLDLKLFSTSSFAAAQYRSSEPRDVAGVSPRDAAAYLRSHREHVAEAQEIIRSMKAARKSEPEIEVAIRRFVAKCQAEDRQRSQTQSSAVKQMNSEEIKRFVAEHPEVKKQMQDYSADLQRRGKSKDEVLVAVYQRLNELRAGIPQSQASEVQQYRGNSVQPYQSQDVKPYNAEDVKPYAGAEEVKPYRADNERNRPPEIGPDPSRYPRKQNQSASSLLFHTFGLAVPGVAYSFDNYATNTRTTVTAAGTVTKSAIRINANHTYEWNSAWDGKVIRGTWREWDGGLRLDHAQEGKDWIMQELKPASGKATVVLYNDSTQYHGTPLD